MIRLYIINTYNIYALYIYLIRNELKKCVYKKYVRRIRIRFNRRFLNFSLFQRNIFKRETIQRLLTISIKLF